MSTSTIRSPKPPVRPLRQADEPTDAELVERALAGDSWAEEALFRRHVRHVSDAATRLLGRVADADDVVQETFVIALERLGQLRDGAAFRGWLSRIAVNQVRRRLRKRKMLRMLGFVSPPADGDLPACAVDGTRPDLRAELSELSELVATLPTNSRVAWMLHRIEGWSIRDTATAMDKSTASVKRYLQVADRLVREHGRAS